jgi:hypothetical protein
MSAGAAIIGLFTGSQPKFSTFGLIYFIILVVIGWGSDRLLNYISRRQKYEISDVEFEKNIK